MSSDFYTPAFHPKALNVVAWSGRSSGLWQISIPSHPANGGTVVLFENIPKLFKEFEVSFTATGIAPVFHRSSLLTPNRRGPNHCKCRDRSVLYKKSFQARDNDKWRRFSSSIFDASLYEPDVKPSYMEYGETRHWTMKQSSPRTKRFLLPSSDDI